MTKVNDIKVGQVYIAGDNTKVEVTGAVTNNLSKMFVEINGKRGTLPVKDFKKLKLQKSNLCNNI